MKIKLESLKELVSKAIRGVGNNKMIPLTELMGIEVKDGRLTLIVTDGSNQLRVSEFIGEEYEDFYTVVKAETFAKLVEKTTKKEVELNVVNDILEVKGNGTYKLPVTYGVDGNIIKFQDIPEIDGMFEELNVNTLKTILNDARVSVAKTYDIPYLTGYYIGNKVLTTDVLVACNINKNILAVPTLISSQMAFLLHLLTGENVSLYRKDKMLLFKTNSEIIYGKELDGVNEFQDKVIDAIDGLINADTISGVIIKKDLIISALDRLSLFIDSVVDNNAIKFELVEGGLRLTSKATNAEEFIDLEPTGYQPFVCYLDIDMFKNHIQNTSTDLVEIHYGSDKFIKILDGNTTMIVSTVGV